MKRNYCLAIILLSISIWSYAQSGEDKAIRAVLNQISAANKTGNYSLLENVYASDFVFVNASGKKFNRSERMANLKSTTHPDSFSFENVKIRTYGMAAVVNAEVHMKPNGQDEQTSYVTIVLVKKGGRWMEVSAQATTKG